MKFIETETRRSKRLALRRTSASPINELVAAIVLLLPVFFMVLYLVYQASLYWYIKVGVDAAARTEARWLAINFNFLVQQNGNNSANYANWKNDSVRLANCVISREQFINGTIDSAGNFVAGPPPTITEAECLPGPGGQGVVAVKVVYPGSSGLPAWPNPPLEIFGVSLTPISYSVVGVYAADIEQ